MICLEGKRLEFGAAAAAAADGLSRARATTVLAS